jgi:hypothetical protein
MKLRFAITLKKGASTVARAEGLERDPSALTVEEVNEKVIATEQFIERLTGLRCHIEQIN